MVARCDAKRFADRGSASRGRPARSPAGLPTLGAVAAKVCDRAIPGGAAKHLACPRSACRPAPSLSGARRDMNVILDDLTPAQRAAAIQSGPVLVIAGAGTGKTKTLTAAVAHRIAACGMPANRVLAVTFTNKAAAEMTGRIRMALGDGAAPHWTGTFHGLGARQLRMQPGVADLRPGFDILDADDTRRMTRRVMKSMNLAGGGGEGGSVRDPLKLVCNRISKWKDELITPADAPAAAEQLIVQANAGRLAVDPPGLRGAARVVGA